MPDFDIYLSPFTWRYGSDEMRRLWSERNKRLLWRKIWVALAEVQAEYALVTAEQVTDLRVHADEIDISQALEIEVEIQHDLMAELQVFAGQCLTGGGILHLGATSADIEDNADALRLRQSLDLVLESLTALLRLFAQQIEKWAETPIIAFTHLQPAEPSTLGYRLALYAQDLLEDFRALRVIQQGIRGKGFKGAVGTGASYAELMGAEKLAAFEKRLSEELDLPFYSIAAQTYPRKQDYTIVNALASLGASLYKFAFDLRILQSPPIGELAEPFGEKQVGSSAMPFKRNPIRAEKINSLGRYLAQLPRLAWDNAAHSLLERTLDDSANRRAFLPEAFLAADEMLRTAMGILAKLRVDEAAMTRNLGMYSPFAATERVLMALVKAGADRQAMHARLRTHALHAWQVVQDGRSNPLADLICEDAEFQSFLPKETLHGLMDCTSHLGNAPRRAKEMAKMVIEGIGESG